MSKMSKSVTVKSRWFRTKVQSHSQTIFIETIDFEIQLNKSTTKITLTECKKLHVSALILTNGCFGKKTDFLSHKGLFFV